MSSISSASRRGAGLKPRFMQYMDKTARAIIARDGCITEADISKVVADIGIQDRNSIREWIMVRMPEVYYLNLCNMNE